ncbi:hypothetical protein KIPB_007881, partial [Kipferlia bialata]
RSGVCPQRPKNSHFYAGILWRDLDRVELSVPGIQVR